MTGKHMTAGQVAQMVGGQLRGEASTVLTGVAPLESAGPGDLTFADDKHASGLASCAAAAAIVSADVDVPIPVIRVKDVRPAIAKVLASLAPPEDLPPAGVHPSALVAKDAVLGNGCAVGPGAVIGPRARLSDRVTVCALACVGADVQIGPDTVLFEGVVVRRGCRLGARVRVGPNSVIGFEGFGYYFADGAHHRVPHAGNVVIEDDVELGACTCVDRAKFGSTVVGAGSKIDNLVQIAHNVRVGPGCLMAAQAGVAGSSRLGRFVVLGGASGVRDNISLGDGAQLAAFSAAADDLAANQAYAGTPAGPAKDVFRQVKAIEKLPELAKRVRELESRLESLQKSKNL